LKAENVPLTGLSSSAFRFCIDNSFSFNRGPLMQVLGILNTDMSRIPSDTSRYMEFVIDE